MKKSLIIIFLLISFYPPFGGKGAFAQYPTLLKDINTVGNSSPTKYCTVNNIVFFEHNDEVHGYELWRTDGTAAGTYMVKDIYEGNGSGLSSFSGLVEFNGFLYFGAATATQGVELWKSDGTAAGTVIVQDIENGSEGSYPSNLTNCGEYLVFVATTAASGTEVWRTSKTTGNTAMLADINMGAGSISVTEISYFPVFFSGNVFFTVVGTATNDGIWQCSYSCFVGCTALSYPTKIPDTADGRELFPFYNSATNSFDLFFRQPFDVKKYNFTAPTPTITTVATFTIPYIPFYHDLGFEALNNTLFFVGYDATNGFELWKTDGSAAGTALFKNINPNDPESNWTNINGMTLCNNNLYFNANDGTHGDELWKTDGTLAGTVLVNDILPGIDGSFPSKLIVEGTKLYFQTFPTDFNYSKYQVRLYETSNAQLSLLKDFTPIAYIESRFDNILLNQTLIFTGYDAINGFEVWKSNGTAAGTLLVKDISQGSGNASNFFSMSGSGLTYFTATDNADEAYYLWKTDVNNITTKVSNIHTDIYTNFSEINNTLIFSGFTSAIGTELYKSDGTNAGTVLLKDIAAGLDSSDPRNFCKGNNVIFFSAYDGVNGTELWKTDGTTAGTVLVKDINIGDTGSNPNNFIFLNGFLYFVTSYNGALWKSDGTNAGTTMVKDFTTVSYTPMMVFNNKIYFSANDNVNGFELWSSDGTLAGTTMLKDIYAGFNGSSPENLTSNSSFSKFYFTADNGINGRELWVSDGTSAGTILINICPEFPSFPNPIPTGSSPQSLTFAGNLLLFSAYYFNFGGNTYGRELWRSGGTVASTNIIKDINTIPGANGISDLTIDKFPTVAGYVYFPANNGSNGVELWKSNGVTTTMVNDLFLGNNNDGLTPYGKMHASPSGQVFFEGTNGQNGRELWGFRFCPTTLNINMTVQTNTQKQQAAQQIISTSNIANTSLNYGNLDVLYTAGNSITFLPGFQVDSKQLYPLVAPPQYRQTVFKAEIGGCN